MFIQQKTVSALLMGCVILTCSSALSAEKYVPEITTTSAVNETPPPAGQVIKSSLLPDTWYHNGGGLPEDEEPYESIPYGFSGKNKPRCFNKAINYECGLVLTGDRPIIGLSSQAGPAREANVGRVEFPGFGKLRIGFAVGGQSVWLDKFDSIETKMLPGRTVWLCKDTKLKLEAEVTAVNALSVNGAVAHIEVLPPAPKDLKCFWIFGDISPVQKTTAPYGQSWVTKIPETYDIEDDSAEWDGNLSAHTSLLVSNVVLYAGSDWQNQKTGYMEKDIANGFPSNNINITETKTPIVSVVKEIESTDKKWSGDILICWGIKERPAASVAKAYETIVKRNQDAESFSKEIYDRWIESFVVRAENAREKAKSALKELNNEYAKSLSFWEERCARFKIETPDEKLDSLANWAAACGQYYHVGPALTMGHTVYSGYWPHISVGWSGYDACGEHVQTRNHHLFRYALAGESQPYGVKNKVTWTPSYCGLDFGFSQDAEETISFLVEQSFENYLWTGNRDFILKIYPTVKRLVEAEIYVNDEDGDGIFTGRYETWFCDGHSRRPYSAGGTASCYGMLKAASVMAEIAGDAEGAEKYKKYAGLSKAQFQKMLWYPGCGIPTSLNINKIRWTHPEPLEIFMPVERGLLDPLQAYQAVRYLRENVLLKAGKDVTLLYGNDWYPVVWSNHVITGPEILDTLAAAFLANDADHWEDALKTYINACYKMFSPGLTSAVRRNGSGGGISDEVGCFGGFTRLVVMTMFGLEADVPQKTITINPRFPPEWSHASIKTPDISYSFKRDGDIVTYKIDTALDVVPAVNFRVTNAIEKVLVNGKPSSFEISPEVNACCARVKCEVKPPVTIEMFLKPLGTTEVKYQKHIAVNEKTGITVNGFDSFEFIDPQDVFGRSIRTKGNVISVTPSGDGMRTAFVKVKKGNVSYYHPLDYEISKTGLSLVKYEVQPGKKQVVLELRNNTSGELKEQLKVIFAGKTNDLGVVALEPEKSIQGTINIPADGNLVPGRNAIEASIGDVSLKESVVIWNMAEMGFTDKGNAPMAGLVYLDLDKYYNCSFKAEEWKANWMTPMVEFPNMPEIFMTDTGVSFHCAGPENNNQMIRMPFDDKGDKKKTNTMEISVGRKASKIYFLFAGLHTVHESYMPIGEINVKYGDGSVEKTDIIPGRNFDWCRSHYAVDNACIPYGKITGEYHTPMHGALAHLDVLDIAADVSREISSIEITLYPLDTKIGIIGITLLSAVAGEKGLAARYTFEEGEGVVTKDMSGNGHDGRIYNSMWVKPDQLYSLDFGGVGTTANAYIDCGSINVNGELTISAWISAYWWKKTWGGIVYKSDDTYGIRNNCHNPGQIHFRIKGGTNSEVPFCDLMSNTVLEPLKWYHLAATFKPKQFMKIYVNGTYNSGITKQIPSGINSDNNSVLIGAAGRDHFAGVINNVRIYSRAFTDKEVKTLYQSENIYHMTVNPEAQNAGRGAPVLTFNSGLSQLHVFGRGGMEIITQGESYLISSAFSYPDVPSARYNSFSAAGSAVEGEEETWKPEILKTGDNSFRVTGRGGNYRIVRNVKVNPGKVEIADTITNVSKKDQGIMFWHSVLSQKWPDNWYLYGVEKATSSPDGRAPAANPTCFLVRDKTGLGFVAEDDVFRNQLQTEVKIASGSTFSMGSRHFGLAAGKSYTTSFTLYTSFTDYFDFLNNLRTEWGVPEVTIPGPLAFLRVASFDSGFYTKKLAPDPDYFKAFLKRKNIKVFMMCPWYVYWDGFDFTDQQFKETMQKAIRTIKEVQPDSLFLACLETYYYYIPRSILKDTMPLGWAEWHKLPAEGFLPEEAGKIIDQTPWKDSVWRNQDGRVRFNVSDSGVDSNYKVPPLCLVTYPELGNHLYKKRLAQYDFLLDEVGFDGIYQDMFGYGSLNQATYEKWDGYTVDINAQGEIVSKSTGLARLTAPARTAWLKHILSKGKNGKIALVNFGSPTTKMMQAIPYLGFVESADIGHVDVKSIPPDASGCVLSQLSCPLALGSPGEHNAETFMGYVRAYLRYGVLYHHYYAVNLFPESGEGSGEYGPVNHMFPITPCELHCGWVKGRERIVSTVSFSTTWEKKDKPEVHLFNVVGREIEAGDCCQIKERNGKWEIILKIKDWKEIVVIE